MQTSPHRSSFERQQKQLLNQGELAPEYSWVARYKVRQNPNQYLDSTLPAPRPAFSRATSDMLSKYLHLGKADSEAHFDAMMSVI